MRRLQLAYEVTLHYYPSGAGQPNLQLSDSVLTVIPHARPVVVRCLKDIAQTAGNRSSASPTTLFWVLR